MLDDYISELRRWNDKINLVSSASISDDMRSRHIEDSLQICDVASTTGQWLDLGSGAGLPGLVVAIVLRERDIRMGLVEADSRKCAFLRNILRRHDLPVRVHQTRIEDLDHSPVDIVTARALAPLGKLLAYSERLVAPDGVMIFPKGITWRKEVDEARLDWQFDLETTPSRTREGTAILSIRNARRR